jgi:glycosyltransferase involved in cell wall biosynthesis
MRKDIKNNVKISILIPVFNRKKFISECIQSALDQTFTDFEIVVVDNASDDGTWEICKEFAAMDQRVKLFRNEINIGPVRNWIRCAEEARGEYSKIIFSDDTISCDCIEIMLECFEQNKNCAFVFSGAMIGSSKDNCRIYYNKFSRCRIPKFKIELGVVYGLFPLSPGAVLFRTSELKDNILENIPSNIGHDYLSHGAGPDILISLRIINNYTHACYISRPLVFFRQHNDSFTVTNKNNTIKDSYSSAISYQLKLNNKSAWHAHLGKELIKKIILQKNISNISMHSKSLESSGAIYEIIKSIVVFFIYFFIKKLFIAKGVTN